MSFYCFVSGEEADIDTESISDEEYTCISPAKPSLASSRSCLQGVQYAFFQCSTRDASLLTFYLCLYSELAFLGCHKFGGHCHCILRMSHNLPSLLVEAPQQSFCIAILVRIVRHCQNVCARNVKPVPGISLHKWPYLTMWHP